PTFLEQGLALGARAPVYRACVFASSERPAASATTAGEDLAFAGAARLAELLRRGEVTPRALVELYVRRIERLDPTRGAFVSIRAAAALAAGGAARERLRAGESGPPLGVPVAVKDNGALAGEAGAVLHRHGYAQQQPRLP